MLEQAPPRVGRGRSETRAQEQRFAELLLETADLAADCRLRDAQESRCAAVAAELDHSLEVAQRARIQHARLLE